MRAHTIGQHVAIVLSGLWLILAATCSDDTALDLRLRLAEGPEQACPATTCSAIPLPCDSVLSVRILDPAEPLGPYVQTCQDVAATDTLCAIDRAILPATTIPNRRLEVQVALWAKHLVRRQDGAPICPDHLQFAPSGKPILVGSVPALAGRSYYSPGDGQTTVELGCADMTQLAAASCASSTNTSVSAVVTDFSTGVSLAASAADAVSVAVGEPRAQNNPITQAVEWLLNAQQLTTLDRSEQGPSPTWTKQLTARFKNYACTNVLEDGAQATATVTCISARPDTTQVALRGVRLARATLTQVTSALRLLFFPDEGLVIGIVRDAAGNPASGIVVHTTAGTVRYLNATGDSTGTLATSPLGIFVSRDAPFGTIFSAAGATAPVVGGVLVGKVAIVVLELDAL